MIQSAALPIFVPGSAMSETTSRLVGENPGGAPGNPVIPGQFAGILAMQPTLNAPSAGATPVVALPDEPAGLPATILPQTGKMLPSALPQPEITPPAPVLVPAATQVAGLVAKAGPAPEAPLEPAASAPVPTLAKPVKHTLRAPMELREKPAKAAKTAPAQVQPDSPSEAEAPVSEIQPIVGGQVTVQPTLAHQEPQEGAGPTDPKQRTGGPLAAPAPQAAAAPIAPVTAMAEALPFIPVTAVAAPVTVPEQPSGRVRPEPNAPSPALTISDVPLPMAGAASRLRVAAGLPPKAEKRAAPTALSIGDQVAPLAPQLGSMPIAPDQAVATPLTAPAEPRHDFSQLVDRLVAAREAAMPHPVHASLTHAEFGQVQLTFAHDSAGLTVAMASNDPDFARAVTAATPAEHKSGAGDAQNQTQGQTQSGPQQNGSDRRGGRPSVRQTAAANASSNTSSATAAPLPGRAGIFA